MQEKYIKINNLQVSEKLSNFVNDELLKDTNVSSENFWLGLEKTIDELAPKNKNLINWNLSKYCKFFFVSSSKTNSSSGSMATNKSNSLSGTLSATIVRVFPNGNLEIKGQKKLRITEGTEYIRLSGIIRPEDISTTNTVSSAKIAEAQIEYVGAGILDSSTKPGWGSQIFRAISPF